MNRRLALCISVFLLVPILFAAAGGQQEDSDDMMAQDDAMMDEFVFKTVGPQGEEPTNYDAVYVSSDNAAAAKSRSYKAAILLHTSADWTSAVIAGAQSKFDELNVEVVAVTDAQFDPNKQRTDIETALTLQPDIILTLVLDPVSGAVALKQAVDQGVKIVLLSNLPSDFVHGRDYASIVTDDLFNMGKITAEMIGDQLNGQGNVALLFHDANYYVTNQRDASVEAVLRRDYPSINIVDKKGIANPNDGEVIASAILTQYPDVDAIYAPWDTIAEGVVAAVRASGRNDVGVFTMDLGANNVLEMAKGGIVKGVAADLPFVLGETMASIGVLSALGVDTPPFVTVPAVKVQKDSVGTQWKNSLNRPLPPEIEAEL